MNMGEAHNASPDSKEIKMKFRYLGDKEVMQAFGCDFSGGQTPDVTDDNAIKRLSGNRFFEVVEDEGSQQSGSESQETGSSEGEAEAASPIDEQPAEEAQELFQQSGSEKKGGKK